MGLQQGYLPSRLRRHVMRCEQSLPGLGTKVGLRRAQASWQQPMRLRHGFWQGRQPMLRPLLQSLLTVQWRAYLMVTYRVAFAWVTKVHSMGHTEGSIKINTHLL